MRRRNGVKLPEASAVYSRVGLVASDFSNSGVTPVEETAVQQQQKSQPMRWREFTALGLWTLFADLLIFRTLGYSGPALFVALAPLFFLAREFEGKEKWIARIVVVLLWLCAARLAWAGSSLTVTSAVMLILALAMVTSGCLPMVLEGIAYATRVLIDGLIWIFGHRLPGIARGDDRAHAPTTATWLLPIAATAVFGGIFVLANPDLLNWVSKRFTRFADRLWSWFDGLSVWEIPFCLIAFVLGAGLLRPLVPMLRFGPADTKHEIDSSELKPAPLFAAYRNTLITLIVLFAAYLAFEFKTLWHRDFPPGFYYAGYAHQGRRG